ncbi:MAG: family 43 glycosylhydrolase [Chitinophagaceae bacterium]|nr:family 43 glycosylhydrolase [Chitinophagaceae bacterium]
MKKVFFTLAWLQASIGSFAQTGTFIPNPVLPGVADAGIIKFNGEYYVGGVFTRGALYASGDLVHWKGPRLVFTMNNEWATPFGIGGEQIHSNDLNYVNGKFHLYWNVNYWGADRNVVHIGHAEASSINGPFTEPVKSTWFDSRLDPKLFTDDDGSFYFYCVKFSDGNTIWASRMKDPAILSGTPVYMFASLPHTWETIDNRVEEGPWVIKYRGMYYLMYNSNHTAPQYGNYALGVAAAASPLGFNNGNKYPYPVVQSNQIDLEELHPDFLKYQQTEEFRYTVHHPGDNWTKPDFDDGAWQSGRAAFGSNVIEGSTTRKVCTMWKDTAIWARKKFMLNEKASGNFALRVHHDGHMKVYLNGTPVYEGNQNNYLLLTLDTAARKLLHEGENTLSVYGHAGHRSKFLDVSLFDMKDSPADDILFTPGQPNIIRGPNGFEWWMVYMANKNNEPRGQFIDRVHFWDRKLTVDAITARNTPGYHAIPTSPTFQDLFNDSLALVKNKLNADKGNWQIRNNELTVAGAGKALIKNDPVLNYLFEASVKMNGKNNAGVYAWWKDSQNWLRIMLDQKSRSWSTELSNSGKIVSSAYRLPGNFDYTVYHKLDVFKNGDVFSIRLDDIPAPGNAMISLSDASKGLPGLYNAGGSAAFDGVSFTIGWDEYGKEIGGWSRSERSGHPAPSDEGIVSPEKGSWATWKGDTLQHYEFSVQVKTQDTAGYAGVFPLYTNTDNYIQSGFNYASHQFIVSGKSQGKALSQTEISLDRPSSYFADMVHSDFMEKYFLMDGTVLVHGLRLNKMALPGTDSLIENIHDKVNIFYRQGRKWFPLTKYIIDTTGHPGFDILRFDPVWIDEWKFTNKDADDHQFYIYKLWIEEQFRQSYHLRIVRNDGAVKFFVNNKLVKEVKDNYPASHVGLCTTETRASFNGITLFHIPHN